MNVSRKEAQKKIDKLRFTLENNNLSEEKKTKIGKELSALAKYRVIIWLNSSSEEDFESKRQLVMDGFAAATEIISRRIS